MIGPDIVLTLGLASAQPTTGTSQPTTGTSQPTTGTSQPTSAPAPPVGLDPTTVTPGVLGFTVVLLLGIATYFLIRSMNKHLRKIPRDPDTRIPPGPPRAPGNRDSRPPPSG